jgi:hypothetical protein|tara:strand:- start:18 stop:458 length:441 start_codon:yes stop_codon:yes gene_type:complete
MGLAPENTPVDRVVDDGFNTAKANGEVVPIGVYHHLNTQERPVIFSRESYETTMRDHEKFLHLLGTRGRYSMQRDGTIPKGLDLASQYVFGQYLGQEESYVAKLTQDLVLLYFALHSSEQTKSHMAKDFGAVKKELLAEVRKLDDI